ncbi:hypothetical protein K435DRAFT_839587 [Dendrothele bispora CBS 962.96]|uniref:Uncharacterized protein n=1 Tax=Dendrothele bispora (strain CBS 962.96) TaxID=1314807 RepID=A0A4S8M007_DENBC|nr:hypothetical protein K435DRAFT_839587 [Dendrothele bispora CBS 962.96]
MYHCCDPSIDLGHELLFKVTFLWNGFKMLLLIAPTQALLFELSISAPAATVGQSVTGTWALSKVFSSNFKPFDILLDGVSEVQTITAISSFHTQDSFSFSVTTTGTFRVVAALPGGLTFGKSQLFTVMPSQPPPPTFTTTTSPTAPGGNQKASVGHLNVILGIIIGILVFVVIVISLLLYLHKRKDRRKKGARQSARSPEDYSDFFKQNDSLLNPYSEAHSKWDVVDDVSLGPSDSISQAHVRRKKKKKKSPFVPPPTVFSALSEETEETVVAENSTGENSLAAKTGATSTQVESTLSGVGYGVGGKKSDMDGDEGDGSDADSSDQGLFSTANGSRRRRKKNPDIPIITITATTPTPPSTVVTAS